MISFEQALHFMESSINTMPEERIPFTQSLNRVIAQEVIADADMPPFNKSAMDGYACQKADLENELEIIEEIPAGKFPVKQISPGKCARIMTGAMVPEGADMVLMKEHVVEKEPGRIIRITEITGNNICYQAEDVQAGEVLITRGTRLSPAHLAILSAVGCTEPMVFTTPQVAVISTGSELVEPWQKPEIGRIRNSNGYQLVAQVSQTGLSSSYLGIARDEKSSLLAMLSDASERFELVLVSGGVSVGDYDYVPAVIRELDMDIIFQGMNVKPGKHLLLAKKDKCIVVGMPGNPVSSFVLFEVFVKPLLNRLMGCTSRPVMLNIPLEDNYNRKKQDTLFFLPVDISDQGNARLLEYHGSADIRSYMLAKGIMEVPVGVNEIKRGDKVHVRPL